LINDSLYPARDRRVRAMLDLALQTILLLVWNPWWVHKRGQSGRKASAASRSLYPIVLGLGGWCIGALVTTIVERPPAETCSCLPSHITGSAG
jgi:hypothetical protein